MHIPLMAGNYKIRIDREPVIEEEREEEEEEDFEMFQTEREAVGRSGLDDIGDDKGDQAGSNNLKFYPYSNSGLTRSVGTLNLSLSNTELPKQVSRRLGDIKEEEQVGSGVDEFIKGWSPFNEDAPTTPTTTTFGKQSLKNELSPFVNDPDILRKWKFKSSLSKTPINAKEEEKISPSWQDNDVPDQSAFLSPRGLVSKVTQAKADASFPKKLSILNTPVKKSPVMDTSRISNSLMDSPNYLNQSNFTQNTSFFIQSPSVRFLPQLYVEESPFDSFTNTELNKKSAKVRNSQSPAQLHVNRYKKIKKSRNSVLLNNEELTNSLQQFTDDLYGTENENDNGHENANENDNENDFESSKIGEDDLSFFNNFRPRLSNLSNDIDSCSSTDTTPTRKKTLLNNNMKTIESSPSPLKTRRFINAKISTNPDAHLFEKFSNVMAIGDGQFSTVYQVTFTETNKKYAVKAIQPNKFNSMKRILQEIKLLSEISETNLDEEGKEYVIDFISSWNHQTSFYVMTEFCENGNLDIFLREQIIARQVRLEDWRIWKIIVELSLALRFIHDSCHIAHLDLKPANVLITFEGNLKLGDFGMATHLPLEDQSFENEGDREYIAPEIISECVYDFRADIFSLGLMIVEIAANVVLPDNGNAWHKLRSGDLSDAGQLSATDIHSNSLFSDNSKVDTNLTEISDYHNNFNGQRQKHKIPAWVPKFLIDGESLERMVKWMIEPDYKRRPTASEILNAEECIYVEMTRKAGAIVQEDDYGPKPGFFMA
ncbi:hypothetical protein HG535_0B05840 [Zygotorulaspora mrakii]|uniref:Protein kinase domain-containing protein n=1 Tax=Zygotorulaspora mrakii TaxID=42260 RepID=A0A7H9AYQ8_ZYGMR|nr:uncharacterized protein HG535_0B05840 [Zygotorulaspora mrakii]QLG71540.1 hypothetical protein HG535_0B05840 [Zygotorulaspora mrakii]